jgi:hypothetical protein
MNADTNEAYFIEVYNSTFTIVSYATGQQSSSSKGDRPKGTTHEIKHKLTQNLVDAKKYCNEIFLLLKQMGGGAKS